MPKVHIKNSVNEFDGHSDTSLFERWVLISVSLLVVWVLMQSYWYFREQVEKSNMERTVTNIQTTMNMMLAQLLIADRPDEVQMLAQKNPVLMLSETPVNYLGEFALPKTEDLPAGNWYFDSKTRELIYLIEFDNYFKPGKDGKAWIRYETVLTFQNGEKKTGAQLQGRGARRPVQSLQLKPKQAYHWFE